MCSSSLYFHHYNVIWLSRFQKARKHEMWNLEKSGATTDDSPSLNHVSDDTITRSRKWEKKLFSVKPHGFSI